MCTHLIYIDYLRILLKVSLRCIVEENFSQHNKLVDVAYLVMSNISKVVLLNVEEQVCVLTEISVSLIYQNL